MECYITCCAPVCEAGFQVWAVIFFLELERSGLYKQETAIWNVEEPWHKNYNTVADAWEKPERSLSIKSSVKE